MNVTSRFPKKKHPNFVMMSFLLLGHFLEKITCVLLIFFFLGGGHIYLSVFNNSCDISLNFNTERKCEKFTTNTITMTRKKMNFDQKGSLIFEPSARVS